MERIVALTDRYQGSADLPDQLPVFPLRGAILLPRATLPLNIFEPRYLSLFDDAISSHRLICLVQPEDTSGREESPVPRNSPLKRIGCAARITAFEEMNDNRLVVTLTGIARFDVKSEVKITKPYRALSISFERFATDFKPQDNADKGIDRQELLRVLKAHLELHKFKVDWRGIANAPTEILVNALSVIGPYGPEEKQALLEAPDLKTRAEVLIALAEMEIAAGGGGGAGTTLQ